jgi:hypothetical protein
MKKVIIFIILIGFFSCDFKNSQKKEELTFEEQLEVKKITDSYLQEARDNIGMDTSGQSNSPIKILKFRLVPHSEYSNYKDIELTYKNVSKKKIEGVKFSWYCKNVFGEVAENGQSWGVTDEPILPNETTKSQWQMNSKDAKKIKNVIVTEVVFQDDSKWTNK